jgi:hypothetical protein
MIDCSLEEERICSFDIEDIPIGNKTFKETWRKAVKK